MPRPTLLTRDEMLDRAALLGAGDIGERTLRHWETVGALPGSTLRGKQNRTLYPDWYPFAIVAVQLCRVRGHSLAEIAALMPEKLGILRMFPAFADPRGLYAPPDETRT